MHHFDFLQWSIYQSLSQFFVSLRAHFDNITKFLVYICYSLFLSFSFFIHSLYLTNLCWPLPILWNLFLIDLSPAQPLFIFYNLCCMHLSFIFRSLKVTDPILSLAYMSLTIVQPLFPKLSSCFCFFKYLIRFFNFAFIYMQLSPQLFPSCISNSTLCLSASFSFDRFWFLTVSFSLFWVATFKMEYLIFHFAFSFLRCIFNFSPL